MASGSIAFWPRLTRAAMTWTWQSMRPGISVLPLRAMTRAPESLIGLSETSRIRPPSTRTDRSCSPSGLLPSRRRALWKTIGCDTVFLAVRPEWAGWFSSGAPAEHTRPVGGEAAVIGGIVAQDTLLAHPAQL